MGYLMRTLIAGLGLQAGLAAYAADTTAGSLDGLLKNSPFGGRGLDPAAATSALELHGVFVDQGEVFFSLYETSSRSARWVGLNETGNPFTVRSYDATKAEVKVLYQGHEISLGLKQAKVVALVAPPPVPAAGPVPAPAVAVVSGTGTPNDEAIRLAAIAQEISRRRALRQQAMPPRPTPTPAPPK